MEEYMRRCESIAGELTVMMEVSNGGGVRFTDHTDVLSTSSSFNYTKRRKVDATEVLESCRPVDVVQLEIQNRRVVHYQEVSISPVESETAGHVLSSLCSSNEYSCDPAVKHSSGTLDLKVESIKTHEISKFSNVSSFSRETTPCSEVSVGSKTMECSTPKKKSASASSSRKPTASKIPSTTEMEEFFSAAEKYEQKRFADKYNYDIVKDVPLEGRYQWVKLKP